jgi:hypothetical protein
MPSEDPRQTELLEKIREGVDSALAVVGEIDRGLLDCSKRLRVDPTDDTFMALSAGISNLGDLVALVNGIRDGVAHLSSHTVPVETFGSMEKSLSLFHGMQAAMEGKDWITLADLIQYELSPLLAEGEKDLAAVRDRLSRP